MGYYGTGWVESFLVNAALGAYIGAMLAHLFHAVSGAAAARAVAVFVHLCGLSFNAAALAWRWRASGHAPLTNMYESMVFFGCCIALACLMFERAFGTQKLSWFVDVFAVLAIAFASFYADAQARPLVPALQSNWLTVHVVSYFAAYAVLTVSFVSSAVYFFARRRGPGRAASLALLTRRAIRFAFPLLTLGLLTGAVWAKTAWGEYWSWDPKETWSLVTWLVYLNFLHLHHTLPSLAKVLKWRKETPALVENIFAFAGFVTNCFTYLGVNYLLSGLHSYA
jgi:ABC-type transport system involved in cytochrome c biogenesis permease subunit